MAYGQKSLENIPAGDRQFLYDGLILCSTKLHNSTSASIASVYQTNDKTQIFQ